MSLLEKAGKAFDKAGETVSKAAKDPTQTVSDLASTVGNMALDAAEKSPGQILADTGENIKNVTVNAGDMLGDAVDDATTAIGKIGKEAQKLTEPPNNSEDLDDFPDGALESKSPDTEDENEGAVEEAVEEAGEDVEKDTEEEGEETAGEGAEGDEGGETEGENEEGEGGETEGEGEGEGGEAEEDDEEDEEDEEADDEDDEDDEDEDDEEEYNENEMRKLSDYEYKDILLESHKNLQVPNYKEISALCNLIKDKNGVIRDDFHKTMPILTKYEISNVLGARTTQLNSGAFPYIEVDDEQISGYHIAMEELRQKKIPFIIRRPLPSGESEYWRLSDLDVGVHL